MASYHRPGVPLPTKAHARPGRRRDPLAPRGCRDRALGRLVWHELNREAIGAPDDGHTKKNARGWSRSLLHSMLRNERYIGRVVWNKREWFKDPVTRKRRYRERPQNEWIVHEDRKTVSERIANKTVLTLLSDAVRTKEFRAWVQGAMNLAAREHAKEKAENDAVVRLERDVQTQVELVERIGNRLIEAGSSDFLTAKLRAEENKLGS